MKIISALKLRTIDKVVFNTRNGVNLLDVTVKILKSLGYKVNTTEDVKSYNDTINVINDFGNLTLNIEGSRDGESTSRVMLSSALLPLPFKLIINIKALH